MSDACFASPTGCLLSKDAIFGESPNYADSIFHRTATSAEAPIPDWKAPSTWPGAAQTGRRSTVLVYSRGMSPICSDTSDADEAAADSRGKTSRHRYAVPPPPPPPPTSSLGILEDGYTSLAMPHARPAYNSEHVQARLSVSAPPAAPSPGLFPTNTEAHDTQAHPTPPWRKQFNSTGNSLVSFWVELPHVVPSCTNQQQSETCNQNFNLASKALPEDPYSSPTPADPYSTETCSSAHSPAPPPLQHLDARTAATANPPMAPAGVNSGRFRCNMPLLLPPPIPPVCLPLAHNSQGPSRCAPYICRPPPPTAIPPAATSADVGSWGASESQRMRSRQRLRQRRDGVPFPSGLPAKAPLPSRCNHIPVQQHHQQPEKAFLAPRRTCYRCRRRGHEASECPAGQPPHNLHVKT